MTAFALDIIGAALVSHWDILRQDLTIALRQLRRAPMFAAIAGGALALGVGGNVAFFTLVDGVLLRQLPYTGANRIVDITEENIGRGMRNFGISPANFRDVAGDTGTFAGAAIYQSRSGTIRVGETPERTSYTAVGGGFFRVFTERAMFGRVLREEDDFPGSTAVLLSYQFWQRVFRGDPNVVGRLFEMDEKSLRIVGVMPNGFAFPSQNTAFWVPIGLPESEWAQRGARSVQGVARLRPGIVISAAAERAHRTASALAKEYPKSNTGWTVLLRELRASRVEGVRTALILVWGAGGLVLLIAVANVSSLFLTRAVARERELALRVALGARVNRVVRQLLTEALVLVALSTVAGVGIAALVLDAIRPLALDFVPRMQTVELDGRAVVYAALLGLVTAAVLSIAAASSMRGDRVWRALVSTRSSASRQRRRLQRGIVVGEVALAVFVLVAGALIVRTLASVLSQPLGFEANDRITFRIEPPWRVNLAEESPALHEELARDRERVAVRYDALIARLQAIHGVRAVGAVNRLPLTGDWWTTAIRLPERATADDSETLPVYVRPVTPGYLEAMGTRVLRGRGIATSDGAGGEEVIVIDAEFARRAWGDANPLGRDVMLGGPPDQPAPHARVVGVVETIHMDRLDEQLKPTMYVPFAQAREGHYLNWGMDIVAHATGGLTETDIRRVAHEIFPDAAVFRVARIDEIVTRSTADRRFQLLVLGSFGALALILTTVGVGGTLLLAVRERREELAVRLALGAPPALLWWNVQRDGLMLTARGAMLGLAGALAGARIFSGVVYGVPVRDPWALLGATALVLVAAFLAVAIPATRAMRVDPVRAMRE